MKKGISLIVLIITIIIIMILAGAVILTMSDTDMIAKSQEAIIQNDKANVQDAVTLHIASNSIYEYGVTSTGSVVLKDDASKVEVVTAFGVTKISEGPKTTVSGVTMLADGKSTDEITDSIEITDDANAQAAFVYPAYAKSGAKSAVANVSWSTLGIDAPDSYTAGTHTFKVDKNGVVTVAEKE